MTDGDALHREILADPDNDLLRLVYADWLEENGLSERAALIRVQIELVQQHSSKLVALQERLLGSVEDPGLQRRRDWALPESVEEHWPQGIGGWEWHRGFPEVWHCPLAVWEAFAVPLILNAPVRSVVVMDREPVGSITNPRRAERTWFCDDADWVQRPDESCLLPPHLFDLLESDPFDMAMFDHARTYPSRSDAILALSKACLDLATVASASQHETVLERATTRAAKMPQLSQGGRDKRC